MQRPVRPQRRVRAGEYRLSGVERNGRSGRRSIDHNGSSGLPGTSPDICAWSSRSHANEPDGANKGCSK